MLKVDAYFKDPITGETIIYQDNFEWEDVHEFWTAEAAIVYMYTEGNYSCDCNRSTFMGIEDLPCGDTIELLRIVEHGTDRVIWPEPPLDFDKYPALAKSGFVFQV